MMAPRILKFSILLLSVIWLTACAAETYWSKSGSSASQMLRDRSHCRSLATTEVDKEHQLDQQSLRYNPSNSGNSNYRAQMMAFSANKRLNQLTAHCMKQSGYQKTRRP
jgi:hypothetical protein